MARQARSPSASCGRKDARGSLPVVIYIHGAGWVFGNSHTHDRLIRELAVGTGAAVVFPNYSLSPEAQYPTAIEESYAVLRSGSRNTVPRRTSTASRIARRRRLGRRQHDGRADPDGQGAVGDLELAAQVLFYPVTDANFDDRLLRAVR